MIENQDPQPAASSSLVIAEASQIARRRPQALFDLEQPQEVIPLLPVQDLLFAIESIGLSDATDLVALCSPEQVQAFLDLTVWRGLELEPVKLKEWLQVLLDLDGSDLIRHLRGLDPELIQASLRHLCAVVDPQLQPVPETEATYYETPDTYFLLVPQPPADEPDQESVDESERWDPLADDRFPLAVRLVEAMYRQDARLARAFLMEAASCTTSELEHDASRFRAGRLSDLGYEAWDEAAEVLAPVEPAAVAREAGAAAAVRPAPRDGDVAERGGIRIEAYVERGETPLLHDAIERLTTEERDRATLGFTHLANRIAAATFCPPGEPAAMAEVLGRARRGLQLGLEFVSRAREEPPRDVLARVPVVRLFQAGHGLTLRLQRLVSTLVRSGRVSLARRGFTLLDPPWRELAEGLSLRFPELCRGLDPVPAEGFRPFLTLADVAAAAEAVEDLGALWPLCFVGLGMSPAWLTAAGLRGCQPSGPGAVRLGDLFRTAAVRQLLGAPLAVEPLDPAAVGRARERLRALQERPDEGQGSVTAAVLAALAGRAYPPPTRLERIVRLWLAPLAPDRLESLVLTRS